MSSHEEVFEIGKNAFEVIQKKFPYLQVNVDEGLPVDYSITFPVQERLKHKVNLNVQNDELHFSVSDFWVEWLPSTKKERVKGFIDAVSGFLSGEYRIVENYRGKRCISAKLQSLKGNDWQTISTSTHLWLIPWGKKRSIIVQNV